MEKRELFEAQDIVLIGLFVALITICSFIRIPFGTIPFTLQTLGVFVTAGCLGTKRSFTAVLIYLLLGGIGAPVFGGAGGLGILFGSSGGYITGFVFATIIISVVSSSVKSAGKATRRIMLVLSMLLGEIICLTVGTIQFMFVTNTGLITTIGYCVIPFIIPDIIKIFVATGIIEAVRKADKRYFD